MTTISDQLPPPAAVDAAIVCVLDAEHAARDAIAATEATAVAMVEDARAAARAVALRSESRIRAVRAAFERDASTQVAALDAAAAEADVRHQLESDELARLDVAVVALAKRLTGSGR